MTVPAYLLPLSTMTITKSTGMGRDTVGIVLISLKRLENPEETVPLSMWVQH